MLQTFVLKLVRRTFKEWKIQNHEVTASIDHTVRHKVKKTEIYQNNASNIWKIWHLFSRRLTLRRTIDLVNIQSKACCSETHEKNEKVLRTHCWNLVFMGSRDCSALGFLNNRQIRWLRQYEHNGSREHRSDSNEGENRTWVISHQSSLVKFCNES